VNVVSRPRTAEQIYSELVRLYGRDPTVLRWTPQRSRYQQVSGDRLVNDLGCPPVTSLTTGLTAIIDWHRAAQQLA